MLIFASSFAESDSFRAYFVNNRCKLYDFVIKFIDENGTMEKVFLLPHRTDGENAQNQCMPANGKVIYS